MLWGAGHLRPHPLPLIFSCTTSHPTSLPSKYTFQVFKEDVFLCFSSILQCMYLKKKKIQVDTLTRTLNESASLLKTSDMGLGVFFVSFWFGFWFFVCLFVQRCLVKTLEIYFEEEVSFIKTMSEGAFQQVFIPLPTLKAMSAPYRVHFWRPQPGRKGLLASEQQRNLTHESHSYENQPCWCVHSLSPIQTHSSFF